MQGVGGQKSVLIDLTVDQISTYAGNTRLTTNPRHNELKTSILEQGLTAPLTVTRLPNSEKYTIAAGGNTRLTILKELYQETGDDQFYKIQCNYVPFSTELELLIGHHTENECRGDNSFVERSLMACKLIREVRSRSDGYREVSEKLKKRGVTIHYTLLPTMEYTITRLLPVIPVALKTGMGRPSVQKINALEKLLKKIFQGLSVPVQIAEEIFSEALAANDSELFDLELLRRSLTKTTGMKQLDKETKKLIEINLDLTHHNPNAEIITNITALDIQPGLTEKKKAQSSQPETGSAQTKTDSTVMAELRAKAYFLASSLAESAFSNRDVVQSQSKYGFSIDIPDSQYINTLEPYFWLFIFSLSGVLSDSLADLDRSTKKAGLVRLNKKIRQAGLRENDSIKFLNILEHSVGKIDPIKSIRFVDEFVTHPELTAVESKKIVGLIEIVREIRGRISRGE